MYKTEFHHIYECYFGALDLRPYISKGHYSREDAGAFIGLDRQDPRSLHHLHLEFFPIPMLMKEPVLRDCIVLLQNSSRAIRKPLRLGLFLYCEKGNFVQRMFVDIRIILYPAALCGEEITYLTLVFEWLSYE